MSINDKDIKLLWGRAAGRCSYPGCGAELTQYFEGKYSLTIGEMAHVIAKSLNGPRGGSTIDIDVYDNLILLCPNHHRLIDKAPEGVYTDTMILEWKKNHEIQIRDRLATKSFDSKTELFAHIWNTLVENRSIWSSYGPKSITAQNDPFSNVVSLWNLKKLDTIIPNNIRIVNAIEKNIQYLAKNEISLFYEFKTHSEAFESNAYNRLDSYPLFPQSFMEMIENA